MSALEAVRAELAAATRSLAAASSISTASPAAATAGRVERVAKHRSATLAAARGRVDAVAARRRTGRVANDAAILAAVLKDVPQELAAALAGGGGGGGLTVGALAARADTALGSAAAAEGDGERYGCLRRCVEGTYSAWGGAVLWLLCAITGVKAGRGGSSGGAGREPEGADGEGGEEPEGEGGGRASLGSPGGPNKEA
jgi:hypothetical protein